MLFRSLGMRNLVVVDQRNKVVGMITRQDLMAFHIQERLEEATKAEEDEGISISGSYHSSSAAANYGRDSDTETETSEQEVHSHHL